VTEHELAEQFEKHRRPLVRFAACRHQYVDADIIDMLYTDCWFPLKDSTFKIDKLKSYLEKSLDNRVKNYIRDRLSSQDLMDRGKWMEPSEYAEDGELFSDAGAASNESYATANLPDLRPYEASELEDLCVRVRTAMEHVPPTLAIVGEWYYVDFLSQDDIAKRLNCSHQNVSIMLARFRSLFARQYHHLLSKEL
jgi:RNA polymerase sigma factor (sigma-70 family)